MADVYTAQGGRARIDILPAPLEGDELAQIERLAEEARDARRRRNDHTAAGRKAYWSAYAETKRRRERVKAYWIAKWRQKKED